MYNIATSSSYVNKFKFTVTPTTCLNPAKITWSFTAPTTTDCTFTGLKDSGDATLYSVTSVCTKLQPGDPPHLTIVVSAMQNSWVDVSGSYSEIQTEEESVPLTLTADCSMPWLSGNQQTMPQINATFGSASVLNSATLNLDLVLLNKRKVYCGVPTCNFQILGAGDSITPTSPTTYNQLTIFNN